MPIDIGGDFRIAINKPIDVRMSVTNFSNLNAIVNRYDGLICYVTSEKNLYIYQGSDIWEKVVTNNVDYIEISRNGGTFDVDQNSNGNVIYVNSPVEVNARMIGNISSYPIGYNVTIIQEGVGNINIQALAPLEVKNRGNFLKTAGQYSIVSILRFKNTGLFMVYGDLI